MSLKIRLYSHRKKGPEYFSMLLENAKALPEVVIWQNRAFIKFAGSPKNNQYREATTSKARALTSED